MATTQPAHSGYSYAMHPYSAARRVGNIVFISGQLGIGESGELSGDLATETRQALANLQTHLAQSGAGLFDVVKISVYLADIADRDIFDPIYAEHFADPRPARSCVAAGLPFGARVEIDAIACISPDGDLRPEVAE